MASEKIQKTIDAAIRRAEKVIAKHQAKIDELKREIEQLRATLASVDTTGEFEFKV